MSYVNMKRVRPKPSQLSNSYIHSTHITNPNPNPTPTPNSNSKPQTPNLNSFPFYASSLNFRLTLLTQCRSSVGVSYPSPLKTCLPPPLASPSLPEQNEHSPKMSPTIITHNLRPCNPRRRILIPSNRARNPLKKRRPPTSRRKLRGALIQRCIATGTRV